MKFQLIIKLTSDWEILFGCPLTFDLGIFSSGLVKVKAKAELGKDNTSFS